MLETLLPILIFTALTLAAIGAVRRMRLWRQGRPSPVNLLKGLAAVPRRYLVDLHHVVGRDKMISNTHVATAGGFVAAAVLMILVHGLGLANPLLGGCCCWPALPCLSVACLWRDGVSIPPPGFPRAPGCVCPRV